MTNKINLLFITWFILWILALLVLPRSYHDTLFFILGATPVVGWFLMAPISRLRWLAQVVLGIDRRG